MYYRLCESYRDEYGRSKWRNVLGLGRMEHFNKKQREAFMVRLNEMLRGAPGLFIAADDPQLESYTQNIFNQLIDSGKINVQEVVSGKRYRDLQAAELRAKADLVKASSLRHKDVREVGCEHLCHQTIKKLKLEECLSACGFNSYERALALTHIISRAVHPASELATVEWIKDRSALCELTGCDREKITKDKLYQIALLLLDHKDKLETHLSFKTHELFDFEDGIIIYDLSNTFYEGAMLSSKMARFGRSKEKRSDCKLLVLAMVINQQGFPKHYRLFEGNMSDPASLVHIIDSLDERMGINSKTDVEVPKPTIVMDAGISTEDNLLLLRKRGYNYLCVSRSKLTDYSVDSRASVVHITDKKDRPIELLKIQSNESNDKFLWVRSQMKAVKEDQMNAQFCQRFEQDLNNIKTSLHKKGGTKKADKVNRRIGRAQQKYPSVQGWYELTLSTSDDIVQELTWKLLPSKENVRPAGVYFLRTSLDESDERTLWMIYNTIREVEYTFSVLKSDLDIRPIYHKSDRASLAHLHLGILAYWLVVTIRYQLAGKGIHKNWKRILEIMDSHKLVTSTMRTPEEHEVVITRCSEPSDKVKEIYKALSLIQEPIKPQKSVRYQMGNQKTCTSDSQDVNQP